MATKNIRGSQNCITQTTAIFLPFFLIIFYFPFISLIYTILMIFCPYILSSHQLSSILYEIHYISLRALIGCQYMFVCVCVCVCTTCVQNQRIVDIYSFLFLHVKLTLCISSSTGKYTSILFLLLGLYFVSSLL